MLPQNPDLPISYQVPGVYAFLSRAGAVPPATNRRVLMLAYKTSAGATPAGTLFRVNSEDDVVIGGGRGSDLHRTYRAYASQSTGTGAEIWAMPMNAPAGTAQQRLIRFLQAPNGAALGTLGTAAVSAGFVTVWICGYRFDTLIAAGDTYAIIAANVAAQIAARQDDLPCTVAVSTDTVTLTARHAALTSADLPVMVTFSSAAMQVAASPGSVTFATEATGAGSARLYVETRSASANIANGDDPEDVAPRLVAAVNAASAFPVTAALTAPSAVVTLFYVADRVFNWAATSITTGIAMTCTPGWGASAAGLPSSASPSLADALSIVNAQDAFKLWVTNFCGAGSVTTTTGVTQSGSVSDFSVLSTLSTTIEQQGNGLSCKGQILLLADTRALATAGSIPVSTTPQLTASPRYFLSWAAGSPQQAHELSARIAALIATHLDYPAFNYAGQALRTDSRVPLLLPHAAVRPSDADCNAAMLSYFLTPLRSNTSGQLAIMSGRTTAKPSASIDPAYVFWGVTLADDFIRDDLRAFLPQVIDGKNLKLYSQPHSQFTTTTDAIRTAVASRMADWDALDIFDGAESLLPGLAAEVNVSLGSRIDVKLLKRFAKPAEQVSVFAQLAG